MNLDEAIRKHFYQFRESYAEYILSDTLCDYIIKNLTTAEKQLFYLRAVEEKTFYVISEQLGVSYKIAREEYQRLSDRIYNDIMAIQKVREEDNIEVFNKDDKYILYNDDFLNSLYIENQSIDLIVTSPPYNVGIQYKEYVDTLDYNIYLQWTGAWLKRAKELIKPDGRMAVNIPIGVYYKNNERAFLVDFINIARACGWKYRNTIFWRKNNLVNKTSSKDLYSAKSPLFFHQYEAIILFYNETWEKNSGSGISSISKEEWWQLISDDWAFPGQSKKEVKHPAPFPITLSSNCIKMLSYVDDLILDPFVGSGTTMVSAAQLNRRCIGVDICNDYLQTAIQRVQEKGMVDQPSLFDIKETYKQGELEI